MTELIREEKFVEFTLCALKLNNEKLIKLLIGKLRKHEQLTLLKMADEECVENLLNYLLKAVDGKKIENFLTWIISLLLIKKDDISPQMK